MRNSVESKGLKITAGVIGLMMLVIVLFSAFYIVAEAEHDCCGDDCQICACIKLCENTLHAVGDVTAALLSFIVPVIFGLFIANILATAVPKETLVSRKVRLNN